MVVAVVDVVVVVAVAVADEITPATATSTSTATTTTLCGYRGTRAGSWSVLRATGKVASVRLTSLVGLLIAGSIFSACDPNEHVDFFQTVTPAPSFPGTAGDPAAYQNLFAHTPDPKCTPEVPFQLDSKTEVRIFVGNGVAASEIGRYAGGLQRYYDFYGVTMFTRYDPIAVPLDHAIVLNDAAIAGWMREVAGVDPACLNSTYPPPACEQAYGAAMFYNVKQFLHAYAEPDRNVINLVLLKRVASLDPGAETGLLNWGIAGLGLSAALVNSAGGSDVNISLAEALDETGFSPTVFIAVNLTDFLLREPDIVVAHEFGHAYGLPHLQPGDSGYGTNLMDPSASDCDLSLRSDQLTTIEQATAAYGDLLDPGHYQGSEILSFTDRAPEILEIVRARVAARALAMGGGQ